MDSASISICMIASSYPRFPGDIAGTFVASLAGALVRQGHRVTVVAPWHPTVAPDPGAGGVVVRRFRYSPLARLHPMGYGEGLVDDRRLRPAVYPLALPYLAAGAAAVYRAARAMAADVMHAHWVIPNAPLGLLAGRLRSTPQVITLHGSDVYLAGANPLLRWVAARCLRGAAAVTACSAELLETASALGGRLDPGWLIPWGADPVRFGTGDPARWRARLCIPAGTPVVAAAGRLVAKKGFDVLVEAFGRLETRDTPSPMLVIGGEGPQSEHLLRRAAETGLAGRVRLSGRVPWDEMPHFLAMADVVAVPSVRDAAGNVDGLPTVLLEAMAAGKPVVASRIAGIPLAIDDECHGLLTAPGDPAALAAALVRLLQDPTLRSALGHNARTRVLSELNWDAVAARYVQVYRAALDRR